MTTTATNLSDIARRAVAKHPNSAIEVAMDFFVGSNLHDFIGTSNDRLVKAGRSVVSMVNLADNPSESTEGSSFPLEDSLQLLVEECRLLLSSEVKVPTVRFGKTELQMPVVTLGCMRFQQAWGPQITKMDQVGSDCQDNLVAILKQAIQYGITHIETARGYGCSELQLGTALKQLFQTGFCKREDLIVQTKIPPNEKVADFRNAVETSLRCLQMDYVDLFAFHGMNFEDQWDWVFGKSDSDQESCMSVIREYQKAGKIRHIGFSTHGSTDLILRLIATDAFKYVNLHYHYFGSYTASGGGQDGSGNLESVKLLQQKDMGVFIISPFDKGGRLYAPSKRLRRLTLPDAEPMTFMGFWVWNHHLLQQDDVDTPCLPHLHTFTVGAGRPSDLDQPAVAAYLHASKPNQTLARVRTIVERLDDKKDEVLGKDWVKSWWKGLPKATHSKTFVEHNQIVWIYNNILAFGMYEFGKARYNSFEKNGEKWDWNLPAEKNIENIGRNGWGFVPGLPLDPEADYSDDLKNVPPENLERVTEALAFVYKWCHEDMKSREQEDVKNQILSKIRRNFSVSSQMLRVGDSTIEEEKGIAAPAAEEPTPSDWETAYDMRPWRDFPDRT